MTKRAAVLALALLLPLTSGCIAAAAIPLAAGAAVLGTQTDRRGSGDTAEPERISASARSDIKVERLALTALPPPDHVTLGANSAIPAFRTYALAQAEALARSGRGASAILSSASDLSARRADCSALPSAVFVDLDPGRGTFDPLAPGKADPALGSALAELRGQGVSVVWFSRLGTNFAPAVRTALIESGLDPAGGDTVTLLSDLGERKQSLRDDAARRLCPIAMLGDERADFDELYLYLRNPDAALALDAMIGNGWFLAGPFTQGAAPAIGDNP